MSDYYDLGRYSRSVSTASEAARQWFNRGLIWTYAFNHLEAVRCFERAAEADPGCAMAQWGIAYAIGPYYNKQWSRFDPVDLAATLAKAHAASQRALALAPQATEVERALIHALVDRYPSAEPAVDLDAWNDAYADAMRLVYRKHEDDLEVCTLFADAMMNRTPWALWDLVTGEPAEGADTLEALAVVEGAFEKVDGAKDHPGLIHLYIHLLEMSPTPEKALMAADGLRRIAPDAGHFCHMPTHIDVQCGHYHEVVASNDLAIEADQKFAEREAAWDSFHALSRAHNLHFKLYGAMLMGNYRAARAAADGLTVNISESLLRVESPPMADWLEGYLAMRVHADIRFGQWERILAEPFPEDRELYCSVVAFQYYARGVAHAVLGNVDAAAREQASFEEARAAVPASRCVFNNTCQDLLAIAERMLEGELAYRREEYDAAFAALREAVRLSDALPYDEPWGWMQPARHALGALLLEQGQVESAEAIYRADLGFDDSIHRPCRHPNNVWALHGYHECLVRLGKTDEAQLVGSQLKIAQARTDIPIRASCLCRVKDVA